MMEVERYGIEAIPRTARSNSWGGLLVIQTAMALSFPTLVIGLLLVPGLSWKQSIVANLLGNLLLGSLVALMGYFGTDHGIPAAVSARFVFGYPWGSHLCSLLLVISMIGWYAVTEELAGVALNGIVQSTTGLSSPLLLIFLIGVLNVIPALIGFENLKTIGLAATVALFYLCGWIIFAACRTRNLGAMAHYTPTGEITLPTAIDWIVSSFIAGAYIASDYSRHIKSRAGNWAACMLGVAPPSILLTLAGILARLSTSQSDPTEAIRALGLGVPGLLLVVFSTVPSLETMVYSGGLATTNLFPRQKRWVNTLLMGSVGILLACTRVTRHLGEFLSILSYVFSPIIGITLTDYFFLRRCNVPIDREAERSPARSLATPLLSAAVGMTAGYAGRRCCPVTVSSLVVSGLGYFLLRQFWPIIEHAPQ